MKKSFATILISLGLAASSLTAPQSAIASPVGVNPYDIESVRNVYVNTYLPALETAIDWDGAVTGCNPGKPSVTTQNATFTAINFVRALAGLPNVSENVAESAVTQKAALMMHAAERLSHDRTSAWPCYTAEGAKAAPAQGGFEIVATQPGALAIPLYLEDPSSNGINNRKLGHRQALLSPQVRQMGSGSTTKYNVIHGISDSYVSGIPDFWSWPSQGYFPAQLARSLAHKGTVSGYYNAGDADWSFYLKEGSLSKATVTVTKNGNPVAINSVRLIDGKTRDSTDAIGWTMPSISYPDTEIDTYRVTVSGISGSITGSTVSYEVKLFTATRSAFDPPRTSIATAKATPLIWNGKDITSKIKVSLDGKALISGTDYLLTVNGNTTQIGKVKITISGIGQYVGTSTQWVLVNPPAVALRATAAAKGAITAKWSKAPVKAKITAYQLQYRVKDSTAWKGKLVNATSASVKISKLSKGKQYQFRVRPAKTIKTGTSKGTYYGAWSATRLSAKVR